jgi:hypothetical protein
MQCVQDGLLGVVSVGSYVCCGGVHRVHGRRLGFEVRITVFGHTTIEIISTSDHYCDRLHQHHLLSSFVGGIPHTTEGSGSGSAVVAQLLPTRTAKVSAQSIHVPRTWDKVFLTEECLARPRVWGVFDMTRLDGRIRG